MLAGVRGTVVRVHITESSLVAEKAVTGKAVLQVATNSMNTADILTLIDVFFTLLSCIAISADALVGTPGVLAATSILAGGGEALVNFKFTPERAKV